MHDFIWIIPLMPLLGAIINGLFGHILKGKAGFIASVAVLISFLYTVRAFFIVMDGTIIHNELFTWIQAGDFTAGAAVLVDQLSIVMMLVVTGVGFLIHVYSNGYMHGDRTVGKFFSYLNLFLFSMLMLVMGDNLLLLYLGWEGVGVCSYLLIGYFYEKESASKAGLKAFLANRVGDFGFAIGIFIIFSTIGTITYAGIEGQVDKLMAAGVVTSAALLLFMGACGKSAQFPLYIWLPDAMEGPTPVSALIHAATMVTAGVYMVARLSFLFVRSDVAMMVIVIIGTFTALFAATMALVNNDIKRVLAYSTISQLGYMFIGVGVGAFAAGVFHLMTHAFFKALLFLGAGAVMHSLADETDIRKMGNLYGKIKITALTFIMAWLAISGIPPFSGFFSKDEILAHAFLYSPLVWVFGAIGAFLTAFYMSRLVFLTFFGESRVEPEVEKHIHENPPVMTIPLMVLAVLSVVGGLIGIPAGLAYLWGGENHFANFLSPVFANAASYSEPHHISHALEYGLMAASILIALGGIYLAYLMYIKKAMDPDAIANRFSGAYKVLSNKYYVDEGVEAGILNPIVRFSQWLWHFVDTRVIDGFVNSAGKIVWLLSLIARRVQTGYVQHYASVMVVGVILILAYYIFR